MEEEYSRIVGELNLDSKFKRSKREKESRSEWLSRLRDALRNKGLDEGLAQTLTHRLENPHIEADQPPTSTERPLPLPREPSEWPDSQTKALFDSFKVRSESYTKPLSEGVFIQLAIARGIASIDALPMIIDLGREGHWFPKSINGNIVWSNGSLAFERWTCHRDGR